jgi:hypothetical protein
LETTGGLAAGFAAVLNVQFSVLFATDEITQVLVVDPLLAVTTSSEPTIKLDTEIVGVASFVILSAVSDLPAGVESDATTRSGVLGEGMRIGPTTGD